MRLKVPPTDEQKHALLAFADSHLGIPYDLGFDLHSHHTFCSKFVHDAVLSATGQSIGSEETFGQLLRNNPQAPLGFWKAWFVGRIPWERTTITPASELESPLLTPVVKNRV